MDYKNLNEMIIKINYDSYKCLLIYNYIRGDQLMAHVLFIKSKFTYYCYELKFFWYTFIKNYQII